MNNLTALRPVNDFLFFFLNLIHDLFIFSALLAKAFSNSVDSDRIAQKESSANSVDPDEWDGFNALYHQDLQCLPLGFCPLLKNKYSSRQQTYLTAISPGSTRYAILFFS